VRATVTPNAVVELSTKSGTSIEPTIALNDVVLIAENPYPET
jgi:hypothetical protein